MMVNPLKHSQSRSTSDIDSHQGRYNHHSFDCINHMQKLSSKSMHHYIFNINSSFKNILILILRSFKKLPGNFRSKSKNICSINLQQCISNYFYMILYPGSILQYYEHPSLVYKFPSSHSSSGSLIPSPFIFNIQTNTTSAFTL